MNTKKATNTKDTSKSTPSMPFMVNKSAYYTLFAPGGIYHKYFEEMIREAEKNRDFYDLFIRFASMGYICGLKEARKKGGAI